MIQTLDEYCNPIENHFIATNHEHLFFKKSCTATKPISFCENKGIRIDRVIECELVEPKSLMKESEYTLKFGYNYKFSDNKRYRADFKLDVVKKGRHRLIWIH